MIDPIFHGSAQPFLEEGHFLLEHWPEHDEGTPEISCSRCNKGVYHKDHGTIRSWFETGYVLLDGHDEDGEPIYEVHIYCHWCSANMDMWMPQVNEKYWLHDDGTYQFENAEPEGVSWGVGESE
jgi:hypothetical protein